jgi:hypothetical protein
MNRHAFSLVNIRRGLRSPERREAHKLLSKMDIEGVCSSPRFPKAKPFFEQAYLAKSQVDALSQTSPRINKNKFQNQSGIVKPISLSKIDKEETQRLPPLKPKRFNEDIPDDVSVLSKGSKFSRLKLQPHSPEHLSRMISMNRMHKNMLGQSQVTSQSTSHLILPKNLLERPSNPNVILIMFLCKIDNLFRSKQIISKKG